jgi:hypothetical protein
MKTNLFYLFILLFGTNNIFSQSPWIPLDASGRTTLEITNLQSTREALNFTVTLHGFYSQDTTVNSMTFQRIFLPNGSLLDSVGTPEIPFYTTLLAIPACDSIQFNIEPLDSTTLLGYNIFPTPEIQYDSIIKELVMKFFMDPGAYSQNDFLPVNTCIT